MLKVLIADDERISREIISLLLANQPEIESIEQVSDGQQVLQKVQSSRPDILFLDIQMPVIDGISVVKEIQADVLPLVIFATAYDEFALQAFDLHAVDYVLKPFSLSRLETALEKARNRLLLKKQGADKANLISAFQEMDRSRQYDQKLRIESSDVTASAVTSGRLPIKDGQQTYLVNFDDIGWIDAAGDYMCVHAAGQTYILRSTMKELEQRLPAIFARVHRSTIVNLSKTQSVDALPKGEFLLHLDDEVSIKVSRNYRSAVQRFLV